MLCYNAYNFPYEGVIKSCGVLEKPPRARGKRYQKNIINAVCAFDIETTNLTPNNTSMLVKDYPIKGWSTCGYNPRYASNKHITPAYTKIASRKQSAMYVWQFAFTEHFCIMGRTWDEFKYFMDECEKYLDKKECIIIYVHLLSFEFQFLKGVLDFESDDVFAIDSRKILTARYHNHFEFRCSYLLANMSLAEFTKKMNVQHVKQSGEEYEYSKQRFPWTKLTDQEIKYCVHDVVGLVEAIKVLMDTEGDDLYSVPMTSTGYVRRDMKAAMKDKSRYYWKDLQPSLTTYKMLREAFRGGNTHANRWYVGDNSTSESAIFDNYNVYTFDEASAYPAVMLNGRYPVTEFREVQFPKRQQFLNLLNEQTADGRKYALLVRIELHNVRLKNRAWGAPYLSRDKCNIPRLRGEDGRLHNTAQYDNGRVLYADQLTTTITDIDFDIICKEYDFDDDYIIKCLLVSKYGYLPECIKDVVRKYFRQKTELKQDKDDPNYNEEQEIYYIKSKNKLNACYGLFATNPIHALVQLCGLLDRDDNIVLDSEGKPCQTFNVIQPSIEEIERQLDYLDIVPAFPYQWGVWVTALARLQLERGLDHVYKYFDPFTCYFVYCDTDSVKYVDEYGVVDWSDFNAEIREQSIKNGGVAQSADGKEYVLGVFEFDGFARRFRTMGAKRYAYEDKNGDIHITVAGVNKRKGALELAKMGGLDAFNDDMIFMSAGGTTATYNDAESNPLITASGNVLRLTSNVYIADTTKRISRDGAYILLTDIDPEERNNYIKFNYQMCKEYVNTVDI